MNAKERSDKLLKKGGTTKLWTSPGPMGISYPVTNSQHESLEAIAAILTQHPEGFYCSQGDDGLITLGYTKQIHKRKAGGRGISVDVDRRGRVWRNVSSR